MRRKAINKYRAAKSFKRSVQKTKVPNLRSNPMRGGWRM